MENTLYDVLEVSKTASPAVIRAAYKSLVQRYHPDKNPDNPDAAALLQLINNAFETLSDPETRREYDLMLMEEELARRQSAVEESIPQEPLPEQTAFVDIEAEKETIPEAAAPKKAKNWILPLLIGVVVVGVVAEIFFTGMLVSRHPAPAEKKIPQPVSAPVPQPAVPSQPAAVAGSAAVPEKPVMPKVPEPRPFAEKPAKPSAPAPQKMEPKAAIVPEPVPIVPQPTSKPSVVKPSTSKYADLATAVSFGDKAAVVKMLDEGYEVNQIKNNQLPLIVAVKNGDVEMAKLLIQHGADVNMTDASGNTAMMHAKIKADPKMIEILKNAGAKNPFE